MSRSESLTLAQLRAFLAAARRGSFTSAAKELGTSQASISELIRRLEQTYRLVLFSRTGRRVALTSAGELLVPIAEGALAAVGNADKSLRAFAGLTGGVATFGVMRNAEYYLLPDLAQQFYEMHPKVQVRLIGQNSVDVAAAVAAGELEAGLVVLPVNVAGLDVRTLLHDEVFLASTDVQQYGPVVTAETIGRIPLILYDARYGWEEPTRRQLFERAQTAGVEARPIIEVEHVMSALRIAARGIGATIVSRAVMKAPGFPAELDLISFDPPMFDVVASITRDAGILSPASRRLLELAEAMLLERSGL